MATSGEARWAEVFELFQQTALAEAKAANAPVITQSDLRAALMLLDMPRTPEQVKRLCMIFAENRSAVTKDEFITIAAELSHEDSDIAMSALEGFKLIDQDGTGMLTTRQLIRLSKMFEDNPLSEAEADEMLLSLSNTGTPALSYDQLVQIERSLR